MKKSCGYKEASTRLHAATRLDVTVHLLDKHYCILSCQRVRILRCKRGSHVVAKAGESVSARVGRPGPHAERGVRLSWMAGLVSSGRTLAAPENLHPNPALVWRGVKVCAREARRGP